MHIYINLAGKPIYSGFYDIFYLYFKRYLILFAYTRLLTYILNNPGERRDTWVNGLFFDHIWSNLVNVSCLVQPFEQNVGEGDWDGWGGGGGGGVGEGACNLVLM